MKTNTSQSWRKVRLGDVANLQNGYAFKSSDFGKVGHPVLKIKSMASGQIIIDDNARYSGSIEKLNKYLINYGDILISMTGSNLSQINSAVGKVTQYRERITSLLNQRVGKIYPKEELCLNQFLFYVLSDIKAQEFWAKRGSGAANQANISPEIIKSFEFIIPPLADQKQISDILVAYDDLIDNNTRRIKILEQVVRSVYAEWFIDFRFNNHEELKLIDSGDPKFGKIPEGWSIENLSEYVDFVRGVEPGSDEYRADFKKGRVPFLRVGDLGSRSSQIYVEESIAGDKLIKKEDIAVTMDGTVGRVAIGLYGAYSTGIRKLVVKNERINREYLYLLMLSDHIQNIIKSHAKGTTILHASESIKFMRFILPNKQVIDDFGILIKPAIDGILVLREQIEHLVGVRSSLAPKLVTGEINV